MYLYHIISDTEERTSCYYIFTFHCSGVGDNFQGFVFCWFFVYISYLFVSSFCQRKSRMTQCWKKKSQRWAWLICGQSLPILYTLLQQNLPFRKAAIQVWPHTVPFVFVCKTFWMLLRACNPIKLVLLDFTTVDVKVADERKINQWNAFSLFLGYCYLSSAKAMKVLCFEKNVVLVSVSPHF